MQLLNIISKSSAFTCRCDTNPIYIFWSISFYWIKNVIEVFQDNKNVLLIMNCAKNILFIVITWAYHLIWEYQRHRQSSKLSTESCPNEKKTRPLWHEFFIVSIFILYTLFISNYLFNYVHSITEIQLVETYPVGLYHLLNFFFREVFNDFNCCSCKSLTLTLDNARLSLQNLSTNLTQVHLCANFQEGKMHFLHSEHIQHSFATF